MKNILYALIAGILVLTGCKTNIYTEEPTTDTESSVTEEVPPSATPETEIFVPEELITPEPIVPEEFHEDLSSTEITIPEDYNLYISDVSVDDMITYFNEVVLDSEFNTEGDPTVVQKWNAPIYYYIEGIPTTEDLSVITNFTNWLNTIPGFPGMYEAASEYEANLHMHFCTSEELTEIMGDNYTYMDGAVHYWYEENAIYTETICIRNDIDQYIRNSVILEEIYNGLGPVQDTMLRPDSLIYQEYATPQELTEVDEVILKLLYHPDMLCGMNASECEHVIRNLYN